MDIEIVRRKLEREMGDVILAALHDPKTVEVMVNPDGKIWHERLGEPMKYVGDISRFHAEAIVKTISGFHSREVTKHSPILECELPIDGSRFAGQLPPIVPAPSFAIRKKAVSVFTLDQYVEKEIMTEAQRLIIVDAVRTHKNILVIGGTGSGKTTLVNAIINEMVHSCPNERVVIIEDTGEIQCSASNFVQFHTTIDVTMTHLLKTTLRMRPDRILVGEVRGPEALDLLDAWNTGHPGGAATLHANNAMSGLTRLKSLISRNEHAPADIEPLIAEAVQLVVCIAREHNGRRVQGIIEVTGYANGQYCLTHIV